MISFFGGSLIIIMESLCLLQLVLDVTMDAHELLVLIVCSSLLSKHVSSCFVDVFTI